MKKSIIKNISLGIACLLAVGGSIAAASAFNADKPFVEVHADGAIQYISRSWDDTNEEVADTPSTCETYTIVASDTISWTDGGWYVFGSDTTINDRVSVTGTANLILTDGFTLTVKRGINVSEGNTLNIYGQTNGTGTLLCTHALSDVAGIGGEYEGNAGTVNIHGGNITASGGSAGGAGIGGGREGDAGTITIYGGTITATGNAGGAGIGGGNTGDAGTVTIYGGTVTAIATESYSEAGAGIGGGCVGSGGIVNILGGFVDARGCPTYSVGIGHGAYSSVDGTLNIADSLNLFNPYLVEKVDDDYARSVNMTVTSAATVTFNANGGTINSGDFDVYGEGIVTPLPTNVTKTDYGFGGWYTDSALTEGPVTEISANARGALEFWAKWVISISYIERSWDSTNNIVVDTPRICSDYHIVDSNELTWSTGWYVLESDVTFEQFEEPITVNGNVNLILMDGYTLTVNSCIVVNSGNTLNIYSQSGGTGALDVTGDDDNRPIAAGIGSEYDINTSTAHDCGTINIYGGNVTATGGLSSAGIGGGDKAAGGEVVIYGGTVTATGGIRSAGIGGGENGADGGTVNILGGTVTATGRYGSAAIGGGYGGAGGIVNISGGTVVAKGGDEGAGIGGGYGGDGGTVTISGGKVTASAGSSNASGIGKGKDGSNGTLTVNNDSLAVFGDTDKNPPTTIRTNTEYETTRWKYMAVKVPHDHNWSYSADGATITASCSNPECPITEGLTLELQAPTSLTYDGNAKAATLKAGYSEEAFPSPTINYYQGTSEITSCVNVGTYTAKVTFGTATATKEFTIAQATPTPDIPTGLVATYGDKLSSVALPTNWSWKNPEDSVGNAGNREHIAIYTPTDPNYKSVEKTITVSVSQATPTPDIPTGLVATYGDELSSVALPTNWSWKAPTDEVGDVGERTHVAIYTPTDPNYKAIEANIIISVAQATPTPEAPTGLAATYGDTLSSVALPSGWAWKNPEDSVGNAGNREHIAIYTPADPNYKAVEHILTVAVAKANPSVPTLDTIEAPCGVALSTIALPEGFSWMDEDQRTSTLGENTFKAKYTPADQDNYNVIENIDVIVNVKWILSDPTQGDVSVTINGDNEVFTTDISMKVEVKNEVTVDEKRNEYASLATEGFVKPNEDISAIYEVKLIRTTNGVEEEIQPSDIKPGTKVTVSMAIPEELVGKDFRLLHIHDGDDISEVTNYVVSKDGKTLTVEVDRLSEFAFIGATDKDNGFIYNSTPAWALILLIIFSIILLAGIYCLYCLIKDGNGSSNNGGKPVKTMSIAFISPVLLAYSGLHGIIIAFIIVASLAVIVWATNLCLFLFNRKKKKKTMEANNSIETEDDVKPVEEAINETNEDEEEVVTVKDEKGNAFQIRFIKSFTAKLIQSPIETKKYYEELKNEVLSYSGTHSRVSWHFDAVNAGREYVLKFAIRGKTLCVYLPLNADDYADSKYKVEKVESKRYEDVPCLYRIKNDRRLGYVKELIAAVASNLGLEKGEEQHEIYSNLPYEENKPLLERGLIKEIKIKNK